MADLVHPDDACPICGERNQGLLVWYSDEYVQCATCGCTYGPRQTPGPTAAWQAILASKARKE